MIDEQVLRRERLPVDEGLMGEAYKVIDKYLLDKIGDDDVQTNMREIRWLLHNEIKTKEGALCSKLPGRVCISELMQTGDRSIAMNALLRLNELAKIAESKSPLSIDETNHLIENNRIARDPFGRRKKLRPDLLPRLDSLIIKIAVRRAEIALPRYRDIMRTITTLRSYRTVEDLWDPILELRLGKNVDLTFSRRPSKTLMWIQVMPNAFELSEMRLFNKFVRSQMSYSHLQGVPKDARYRFELIIKQPCLDYIDIVSNLITSFKFSLDFREFLAQDTLESIDRDLLIHKAQAYFSMCKKLIKDGDAFVDAYRNYLASLVSQRINKVFD